MHWRWIHPLIGGLLFYSTAAWSYSESESMGRFRFSELFLAPRLHLQEPGQGGFDLEQSWLAFEWQRDEWVRGVLKVGSGDLIRPPLWTEHQVQDFGVVEAFMEGRSEFGDLRAGLLTIPQGFEGVYPQWNSILPESWARRKRWLLARDNGVQFFWQRKPFETSFTIHNGEAGANGDGSYWLSSHWAWHQGDGYGFLLSASVGKTRSGATSSASEPGKQGFQFDVNSDAKIRYGILSLFREWQRNLVLVEMGRGDILQNDQRAPYAWGRVDVSFNFGGDANLLLRYEQNQADLRETSSIKKITGLGLVFASADNLQSVSLYGAKNTEFPETTNDEIWLIFRLHSTLLR